MLAIHWSPVANTKRILRNGITKSKVGLYCFPLSGNYLVDRWWVRLFNVVRARKKYNGFVFRISQKDLPAYFGHWAGATSSDYFEKPISSMKELRYEIRNNILFRMGENIQLQNGEYHPETFAQEYIKIAKAELQRNKKARKLIDDFDFKTFALEDLQIVLSGSISPDRIVRIISDGTETGRQRRRRKSTKKVVEE